MTETITYNIKGPIFEININNEIALNSFTIPEFIELAKLFEISDKEPTTSITLITSSGKFFSTGANIKAISKITNSTKLDYYDRITSKNIYLVHTILNHSKLIVVALNGPVIGLSGALVCLMDIIYAREPTEDDGTSPYLQFPFATIGLVNECGVSASLPLRLGISTSLEAVCLARKIKLNELINNGFVTRTFKTDNVPEFNDLVRDDVTNMAKDLSPDSMVENKKMIKLAFNKQVTLQIVDESMNGLQRWVDERPQSAFKAMVLRSKHSKGKL